MSRIKEEHVAAGHPRGEQLSWASRKAVASITRGVGPARQSAPLPLGDVAKLRLGDEPAVRGRPVGQG